MGAEIPTVVCEPFAIYIITNLAKFNYQHNLMSVMSSMYVNLKIYTSRRGNVTTIIPLSSMMMIIMVIMCFVTAR